MNQIIKFELGSPNLSNYEIQVPEGSKILTIDFQESPENILLWILGNNANQLKPLRFEVYMSFQDINSHQSYVGTIINSTGTEFHLFRELDHQGFF